MRLQIGKPESGAAVQARGRCIGLAEGLEQARLGIAGDADAGVAHLEMQLVLRGCFADATHADRDRRRAR